MSESDITWVIPLLGVLYFTPSLVAVARGRRAGGPTFVVNLFYGWTGIGWLLALVVAFLDYRRVTLVQQVVVVSSGARRPGVLVSPDGEWWWDGRQWLDAFVCVPCGALRSPDGAYWWDGTAWRGGLRCSRSSVDSARLEKVDS